MLINRVGRNDVNDIQKQDAAGTRCRDGSTKAPKINHQSRTRRCRCNLYPIVRLSSTLEEAAENGYAYSGGSPPNCAADQGLQVDSATDLSRVPRIFNRKLDLAVRVEVLEFQSNWRIAVGIVRSRLQYGRWRAYCR